MAYLLYDSKCEMCTRFKIIVKLLDFNRKLAPVSIHERFAFELVRGKLSEDDLFRSFHIVRLSESEGSRVFSAADGVVELLGYLPFLAAFKSLISRADLLKGIVGRSYLYATRMRGASCIMIQSIRKETEAFSQESLEAFSSATPPA